MILNIDDLKRQVEGQYTKAALNDIDERLKRETYEKYEVEDLRVTTKEDPYEHHIIDTYKVTNRGYYEDRGYERHIGKTYKMTTMVVKPRRFNSYTEMMNFLKRLQKEAGRTLEKDECTLLLKTIMSGRQYELTCLIDYTDEFKGTTVYERVA